MDRGRWSRKSSRHNNHKGPEAGASGPTFFEALSRSPRRIAPHPTPLARTQGRTRRSRSPTESHSRHQRRWHVAQQLPTRGAMVGAVRFSPHPIPLHFTSWIDTLDSGARHHGHSELPQRPPTHSAEVSSPWRPEIRRTDRADLQILALRTWGVNGKPPRWLVATSQICGKTMNVPTILHLPRPLINAFPSSSPA
jgi:hypothetical protein